MQARNDNHYSNSALVLSLILLGIVSRFLPHIPNFTALVAISALSGRYLANRWIAAALPVVVMLLTDLFLGLHSTMFFIYGSMALISLLSSLLLKDKITWLKVGIFSFSGSVLFFLISNFAVWFMDRMYPSTVAGLMSCFAMAIPFFENQVAGDFLFMFTTFGLMEMLKAFHVQHRPTTSE